MYFANPWGLLALLSVPTILVIHLFHRRFPPLLVAGLHLWSSETRLDLPGRKKEKLPISKSLILELLAAFILSLALGDPRFDQLNKVAHLVVVLDSSASMSGRPAGEENSFFNRALAALDARVQTLPRGSVVTVIATGERPAMLAGPAVAWDEARKKLEIWRPGSPRHRFEPAWDLGMQLLEDQGQLLFLTDHVPQTQAPPSPTSEIKSAKAGTPAPVPQTQELPSRMEVVSVGQKLENWTIDAARWSFDASQGKGQVFARIKNVGTKSQTGTLRALRDQNVLLEKSITLAAGEGESVQFEVPGGLGRLLLELTAPEDGLLIDSRAYLTEPQVRRVSLHVGLPAGDASRIVLRVLKALPDIQMSDRATAHVVFEPAGTLPEVNSRAWWLGIGPISNDEAARKAAQDVSGPYLLERSNPLLEGISLGGVIWGGVQPFSLSQTPLISVGNTAVLARLNGPRIPAILMNIDLAKSNLPESPDWPILLTNLVELRRSELPGLRQWNYRLGETVRFRVYEGEEDPLPGEPGELKLVLPTGDRPIVRGPTVELIGTDEPGWYTVLQGKAEFGRFAVNFVDAEESNLLELAPGRKAPAVTSTTNEIQLDSIYSWLILVCLVIILACLLGDWIVLRPQARGPARR